MSGIKKARFQCLGDIYFFMIWKSVPQGQGEFYIPRRIYFVESEICILPQYPGGIFKHRERETPGGLRGINFSPKSFADQFRNSSQVVHVPVSNEQHVYFLRIIGKGIPIDIIGDFCPLRQPAVDENLFSINFKKEVCARD